jgi:hypothetical protein
MSHTGWADDGGIAENSHGGRSWKQAEKAGEKTRGKSHLTD